MDIDRASDAASDWLARIEAADNLVSELHSLMYDVPLPEQATETHRTKASNLVWKIHEVLRGASRGFCGGKPVTDAASWLDGKPRPPAPCPRCGRTASDLAAIRARADQVLQAMDLDPGPITAEPYAGWAQREALDVLRLLDLIREIATPTGRA